MKLRAGLVSAAFLLLSACATVPPQDPIELSANAVDAKSGRVGVAMTPLPKVDTQFPGAGCLLCIATASAANSSLTTHTRTLPYEDLPKLKNALADALRSKGAEVIVVPDDLDLGALKEFATQGPNIAPKDYTPLKQRYRVDKLVVVQINTLGIRRDYSMYIPTSDPKAILNGIGYMVNLNTNTYEWYAPVNITKSADGPWDEPPSFPGLTNAYFQALELGKDGFLKPFRQTVAADKR